ncbi:MAG TPA: hypothetical protein P5158_05535 [Chitinophagaceae bacterium]|nr:hypothetical protein [Chitinophagaceae bacterium]
MGLNNIDLSPGLLKELYRDMLVIGTGSNTREVSSKNESSKKVKTESKKPELTINTEQKNTVVIVSYPDKTSLPEDEKKFLTDILSACKLSMDDVAIINTEENAPDYKMLVDQYKCRNILLFGISPLSIGLPFDFPEFQVQPFQNINYLSSPPLHEMENDKIVKSKLWVCLKRIFSI